MINSIGKRIKNLRTHLKLSQQDLCNEILCRTVLSKIENDKVVPSVFQLKYIADKLNVHIDYFFLEEPISHPEHITFYSDTDLCRLYKEGQYYNIIHLHEKRLLDDCEDINLRFYLGCSYYAADFLIEAARNLRKYLTTYFKMDSSKKILYVENFAIALNTLCKVMLRNSNYEKAIHYLSLGKKYLEKENKTNLKIYHIIMSNLGAVYCMMNRYNKTIDVLENYLANNKDLTFLKLLPDIHLSLNISYYNKGEYDKSITHIKNAIFLYSYCGRNYDAKHSYLNYINALRYCKKFKEAFSALEEYKHLSSKEDSLRLNFLMQEIILYFNTENYEKAAQLLGFVPLLDLNSLNRNCYYFIKGHLSFLRSNFAEAFSFLEKCESYFYRNNFVYDLKQLYKDMYEITLDELYIRKSNNLNTLNVKKNILIS